MRHRPGAAGLLAFEKDEKPPLSHKMISDQLNRIGDERPAIVGRYVRRHAPWRREMRVKEDAPGEPDRAEHIGKRVGHDAVLRIDRHRVVAEDGAVAGDSHEEADGSAGGFSLVAALDDVERRLATYLSSTAEDREKLTRQEQAQHQLNMYLQRIQRQQAYLDNLKSHQQRVLEQQQRSIDHLFALFKATYRDPDRAFQSIWELFESGGRNKVGFLLQKKPSIFGKLQGWSFLFFKSPKRKQAMRNVHALPDNLTRWIESERKLRETAQKVHEIGNVISFV